MTRVVVKRPERPWPVELWETEEGVAGVERYPALCAPPAAGAASNFDIYRGELAIQRGPSEFQIGKATLRAARDLEPECSLDSLDQIVDYRDFEDICESRWLLRQRQEVPAVLKLPLELVLVVGGEWPWMIASPSIESCYVELVLCALLA